MIDLILAGIGILGVTTSSITDIKKREVPDWVCYAMIASGLGIRALLSLTALDYKPLLYGLLGLGAAFLIANALYYTKQWGGGDSKLLMGIGAVFGNGISLFNLHPPLSFPFLAVFLLNLFIVGTFYALFYAFGLAIKHRKKLFISFKKHNLKFFKISLGLLAFLMAGSFLLEKNLQPLSLVFIIILFFLFNLILFIKDVEKTALERWIPVHQLTEGDWVINTVKVGSTTICSPKDLGLEKKQIELLKKHKIQNVLIKEGIPFVPSFFFALFITLIWGNLLFYLF